MTAVPDELGEGVLLAEQLVDELRGRVAVAVITSRSRGRRPRTADSSAASPGRVPVNSCSSRKPASSSTVVSVSGSSAEFTSATAASSAASVSWVKTTLTDYTSRS